MRRRQDRKYNPESLPPADQRPKGARIYTGKETSEQLELVENLLLQFASVGYIGRRLKEQWGCGNGRANTLVRRIRERWKQETSSDAQQEARHQHTRAIKRALTQVEQKLSSTFGRVELDPQTGKPNFVGEKLRDWVAINRLRIQYLELLADIEGSRQAQEVTVNLNLHAPRIVTEVLGTMDEERLQLLQQEADEEAELAEAYRRDNPGVKVLNVHRGNAE